MNLNIDAFKDPLNLKNGKKKTLNNYFLNLIFKSDIFFKDFMKYTDNFLIDGYKLIIGTKMDKFLS